jgi:hypothetical protein
LLSPLPNDLVRLRSVTAAIYFVQTKGKVDILACCALGISAPLSIV